MNENCGVILETMGSRLEPVYVEEQLGEVKHVYCTTEKLLGYKLI